MKVCPYCGKQGLDFDRATDGVECKKPVVYSLAVGDWVCVFRAENNLEGESGMADVQGTQPSVEEAQALDGKNFAMLGDREREVLSFFAAQRRKFGVAVRIVSDADPEELTLARSREQAEVVMQNANSRVFVTVKNVGEGE